MLAIHLFAFFHDKDRDLPNTPAEKENAIEIQRFHSVLSTHSILVIVFSTSVISFAVAATIGKGIANGISFQANIHVIGFLKHVYHIIDVLRGRIIHGNYICIPNWNIGTEIASLSDFFWNQERLRSNTNLRKVDACSITYALVELSKYIDL